MCEAGPRGRQGRDVLERLTATGARGGGGTSPWTQISWWEKLEFTEVKLILATFGTQTLGFRTPSPILCESGVRQVQGAEAVQTPNGSGPLPCSASTWVRLGFTSCPQVEVIAPLVKSDALFLVLYKEMYYRHVYSLSNGALITLEDRVESFQNYFNLFAYLIKTPAENIDISLPNQWIWDIIDEFIWQYNDYAKFRSKLARMRLQVPSCARIAHKVRAQPHFSHTPAVRPLWVQGRWKLHRPVR